MAVRQKTLIFTLAALVALGFSADSFAKPGAGGSMGSRGARTDSAPPPTATAPRPAAPIERSMTSPSPGMAQNAGAPGMKSGGFMSGGFGRGLLGGLVGAGLIGLLLGNGFGGGLGGLSSILGLVLQIGLLFLVFKLVMGFLRRRQPAPQGAAFENVAAQSPPPGFGGFGGSGGAPAAPVKLEIGPADFNAFEQNLGLIQKAYGAEDMAALRALATPEMASYFAAELQETAKIGQVNKISDVTLLKGDLAEAWREPESEYASVAMRFSLIDTMVDRATGRIVSGDPVKPDVATEIWTFARRPGGATTDWKLSAIQQA
ncbi:Tim44 domain-containing protein [Rhodoblastus acidophilus]|uniref:Tim44 domain-containing protein n=1 Tax=Rhodoblastus acidophilus TaxID=1074 RepID=A0A6N8DJN8_RHOAC|nr:TIM44-like domain-containing protein [Rhodoblastus acidophilus]MCW2274086.1 putative lipid-binding transport protein (Tim44 family) [Rhodoblastus acidophilus]MTV30659.1 Tim44 domain-containing protein [Rhodoblastus acidophilus]